MIYTRAFGQRIICLSKDEWILETAYSPVPGASALCVQVPTYVSFVGCYAAYLTAFCNELEAKKVGMEIMPLYGEIKQ